MIEKVLFDFLKTHNIKYELFRHNPVFTSEENYICLDENGQEKELVIPGTQYKNLFLKDKKNNIFYLVTVPGEKRVDLKALSLALGSSHFSFASAQELYEFLKIQPGSVTPFALMFDTNKKVNFILDQDFVVNPPVNFHPLRNDMTIGMAPQDFLTCMQKIGYEPKIIYIPVK
ncbi:MAG: YbaK/prolyl-tRNA synthetase associated region [candidate division TM6 bacterium GW2011_GWF2_30_66]|nr:MAG: YbaK/prolyl-tRNA synthetase associated region [candidate division TM6 bacterium GW2011_GWF2_30_66]